MISELNIIITKGGTHSMFLMNSRGWNYQDNALGMLTHFGAGALVPAVENNFFVYHSLFSGLLCLPEVTMDSIASEVHSE